MLRSDGKRFDHFPCRGAHLRSRPQPHLPEDCSDFCLCVGMPGEDPYQLSVVRRRRRANPRNKRMIEFNGDLRCCSGCAADIAAASSPHHDFAVVFARVEKDGPATGPSAVPLS